MVNDIEGIEEIHANCFPMADAVDDNDNTYHIERDRIVKFHNKELLKYNYNYYKLNASFL